MIYIASPGERKNKQTNTHVPFLLCRSGSVIGEICSREQLCFRTVVPWIAGGYLNWVGVR